MLKLTENVTHGKPSTYRHYGCRCEPCTESASKVAKKWREDRADKLLEYQRNKRLEFQIKINKIKLEAGCIDCGYKESPVALQFDHIKGKKSFEVGSATTRRWEAVLEEIDKCVVRCANCHWIKTAKEGGWMSSYDERLI